MLFNSSCKTIEGKLQCLESINQSWEKQIYYKQVRSELSDTIKGWINMDIKAVQHYKRNLWKIDEPVFFNTTKNAAIILVLEQDTAKNAKMDDIHLIFAKKNSDIWRFFYHGMNTLTAARYYTKKDPTIPYTFEELSNLGKRKLIEGGYLKKCGCKINDEWVNAWYSETLEGMHRDFLNNK